MSGAAHSRRRSIAALAAALLIAACGQGGAHSGAASKAAAQAAIPVGYVVIRPATVPIEQDLPGRVSASQIAQVRPQVSGIVLRRLFTEGAIVREGQTLYQIDPSVYEAEAAQASANLRSSRAAARTANARLARDQPLLERGFVARQDYDDVLAQAGQANAAIAQSEAALRAAQINLQFTRVPAPMSGRIGLSIVSEGALVTADQSDPLTTITLLDPINVDIQQSAADLLALRRSMARGGALPASAAVHVTLPDGSQYGSTGTVAFSDVIVDPNTGAVTLRASFPNPEGLLLPGMYVRARFAQAVDTVAFLVPQQALNRDPIGNATIWVVGPGNQAVPRTVVAPRTQGAYWVVTQGVAPGEKVIVQGIGNLRPGAVIRPVPAGAPQRVQTQPAAAARSG